MRNLVLPLIAAALLASACSAEKSGGGVPEPSSQAPAKPAGIAMPGESINPIDKGKTLDTGEFRYTLEDVRKQLATDLNDQTHDVYLVLMKAVRTGGQGIPSNDEKTDRLNAEIGVILSPNPPGSDIKGLKGDTYYDDEKYGTVALNPVNQDYVLGQEGEGYLYYDAREDPGGKLYLYVGPPLRTKQAFSIR